MTWAIRVENAYMYYNRKLSVEAANAAVVLALLSELDDLRARHST